MTNSFNFHGEEIIFDWCIEAHPNGASSNGTANLFIITTWIDDMPRAKTVDIKALTISHSISIPDLHILKKCTDKFSEQTYLGWKTINTRDNIKNDVFTKYNIAKYGGFEIIAKISIKKIEFAEKATNKSLQSSNLSKNDNRKDICQYVRYIKKYANGIEKNIIQVE